MPNPSLVADPFLSWEEVAVQLQTSRATVYRLTQRGELGHVRVTRFVKWRQSQVNAYLANATVHPTR